MPESSRFPRPLHWNGLSLLALLLLAVLAFLGWQSRLMGDDFEHFRLGAELGPIAYAQHYRETWQGSYTEHLLYGFISSDPALMTRGAVFGYIVIWTSGLAILAARLLKLLGIGERRRLLSVALAAAIVGAAIHALLTPLSIYYFAASFRYILPLALFTLCLALAPSLIAWARTANRLALAALLAAGCAFVVAGFSEIYLAYQLSALTLALPAVYWLVKRRRWAAVTVFGGAWVGTALSFAAQITAPGVAIRRAHIASIAGAPDEPVVAVAFRAVFEALRIVYDPEIFAAFLLLFCFGLLIMLDRHRPAARDGAPRPSLRIRRNPLLFALAAQLILAPFVFSHTSDFPRLLGRYSASYATVLLINGALVLGLSGLLLARGWVNRHLARRELGLAWLGFPGLVIVLVLFALTQLRPIHWRAMTYLLLSCQLLLVALLWQFTPAVDVKRSALLLAAAYGAFIAINAGVILAQLYTDQKIIPRVLTPLPFGMALLGLHWGLLAGGSAGMAGRASGLAWLKRLSYSAAAAILALMIWRNAGWIAPFQTFAREYDARGEYIIAERERGERIVVIKPLSFDLERHLTQIKPFPMQGSAAWRYGVDGFILDEG